MVWLRLCRISHLTSNVIKRLMNWNRIHKSALWTSMLNNGGYWAIVMRSEACKTGTGVYRGWEPCHHLLLHLLFMLVKIPYTFIYIHSIGLTILWKMLASTEVIWVTFSQSWHLFPEQNAVGRLSRRALPFFPSLPSFIMGIYTPEV